MTTDYEGWNPLSSNKNGFMTDEFDIGCASLHHTINVNPFGDIIKSHTTFNVIDYEDPMKIYPDCNTSLCNTYPDTYDPDFNNGFSWNGF